MFSGWMFILALNLAMAGFKALYDFPQWEDWVWFSGESLEAGRWFVALTATLDHAGYPHLVNNMAMMLLTASEVEGLVGPFGFVVLYFVTGVAGWLLTIALTRYRYRGEEWEYAAKFQVSVGSSPATYGLAALVAVANPNACVGTVGGLPSWVWLGLYFFTPPLCSEKYGVQPWPSKLPSKAEQKDATTVDTPTSQEGGVDVNRDKTLTSSSPSLPQPPSPPPPPPPYQQPPTLVSRWGHQLVLKCGLYLAAAAAISLFLLRHLFHPSTSSSATTCSMTAAGSFSVCLVWVIILRLVDRFFLGRPFGGGSDHKAHLGGALAGAATAGFFTTASKATAAVVDAAAASAASASASASASGETTAAWGAEEVEVWWRSGIFSASGTEQLVVAACFLLLFVRTATDI